MSFQNLNNYRTQSVADDYLTIKFDPMKRVKSIGSVLLLGGLMIVSSCQKDEDESIGLRLQFDLNKNVVNYRSPGDLQFTDGFITIREVVFDGDQVGGESVSISHEAIVIYDFGTGASQPENHAIDIPSGDYNDIYLGIELLDENDSPTLVIEGTYEKEADGKVYPIRFEFNSGEVFEAEAPNGSVPPNTPAIAKITFDPHDWFARVSFNALENAIVNNDGIIVISESSNTAIFDIVADGLDMSTEAVFQ